VRARRNVPVSDARDAPLPPIAEPQRMATTTASRPRD